MALDVLQVNIHGNRTTSDGVIPLPPNPSTRFTGRTEAIAKLKRHFFTDTNESTRLTGRTEAMAKLKRYFFTNTSDAGHKRKFFLLYGMGGIGKTQICLKFIEEMNGR